MKLTPSRALAAGAALVLVALAPGPSRADDATAPASELPLRLVATSVDMEGAGPTVVGTIQITIERWSTDAERKMLVDTLKEKGPDGTGQGKLATTAKVSYSEPTKTIEIENYDIEPVRLQNVHVETGQHAAKSGS